MVKFTSVIPPQSQPAVRMSQYWPMPGFTSLLTHNRNFRYAWISQVISEVGDHFNNIAVFSLALATTRSGLVVSGVMLARAVSAVLAAPVAGVVLDRFDRRTVMIASDMVRAVVAIAFIATIDEPRPWLLYTLSALLMFASPFFTSGRVFATNESLVWSTMMLSMLAAGLASQSFDPRTIGAASGILSSCTALYWIAADRMGLLKEPVPQPTDDDTEPHDRLTA